MEQNCERGGLLEQPRKEARNREERKGRGTESTSEPKRNHQNPGQAITTAANPTCPATACRAHHSGEGSHGRVWTKGTPSRVASAKTHHRETTNDREPATRGKGPTKERGGNRGKEEARTALHAPVQLRTGRSGTTGPQIHSTVSRAHGGTAKKQEHGKGKEDHEACRDKVVYSIQGSGATK